jgi:hypothetical protein
MLYFHRTKFFPFAFQNHWNIIWQHPSTA